MRPRRRHGAAPAPPPDFDPEAFPMWVDLGLDPRPRAEVERIYALTREWADAYDVELHPEWLSPRDPGWARKRWCFRDGRVERWV